MYIALNSDAESEVSGAGVSQMMFDASKQAKLYHMLSASLYSNKPRSILRELCSNAHDSHVQAGIVATPFTIISPTYSNPVLIVKDEGVGLTKEEALRTILCYLGSTKDHTDLFIGGWGIGSKSPFAYAKTYNVVCRKDGRRVEFVCWKDEHGIPTNAVLSDKPTAEGNGVEMHVPVAVGDVRIFTRTVKSYMKWTNYNVVAEVEGQEPIKPSVPVEKVEIDSIPVYLYEDEDEDDAGEIRLVYGGESYEISSLIDKSTDDYGRWHALLESMRSGFRISLVANTPGSIDFNMNREEVEQTPRSIAFINHLTDRIASEAEARANTYDAKMKTSLYTNDGERRLTLGDVEKLIDRVIAEGDANDRVFAKAFEIFESKYNYLFHSVQRQLTLRTGVTGLVTLPYITAPLHRQIAFCYGRTYTPDRSTRAKSIGLYQGAYAKPLLLIYVRASTQEEAVEELGKISDFDGMDLDRYAFHFVDIPRPIRRSVSGMRHARARLYDSETRKYIAWDAQSFYVVMPRRAVAGQDMMDKAMLARIGASLQGGRITLFTPSLDFGKLMEKDDGRVPENVITLDEAYSRWGEAGRDFANEYGGLSYRGIDKLSHFKLTERTTGFGIWTTARRANHLRNKFVAKYKNTVNQGRDTAMCEFVKNYRQGAGAISVQAIVQALKRTGAEIVKYEKVMMYINEPALSHHRSLPEAKKIINALGIKKWL